MQSQFEFDSKNILDRFNPSFIQEAIVKDNRDPQKMGRLKVWIMGSSAIEDNRHSWITCDYASPFAGRTAGSPNAKTYKDYPKSYGFWAVPPDIGTKVFVFFINGRMENSYWFGAAYDFHMNNNVPGALTKTIPTAATSAPLPVTEYDRNSAYSNTESEYPNIPLINGLQSQRILYDEEKGTPNRSGRRQAPNALYGMSSPRGNSIVLDDGYTTDELTAKTWDDDQNGYENTEYGNPVNDTVVGDRKAEGISLRTRSGAQILLSESTGSVFIINRDGTTRIEMDASGNVMILGDRDVSIRAKRDLNFLAERDCNFDVLGNMNLRVGGNYNSEVSGTNNLLNLGAVNWKISSDIAIEASNTSLKSSNLTIDASAISVKGSGSLVLQGSSISLVSSSAIAMSGGGGSMSVSSDMNISGSLHAKNDVTSAGVSLNNHVHNHGEPKTSAPIADSGSSPNVSTPSSASSAPSVSLGVMSPNAYLDVVDVNPDNVTNSKVVNELGKVSEKSLSALAFLMPASGTIQKDGYWGLNVPLQDGTYNNNTGWYIEGTGNVINPFDGYVRVVDKLIIEIDHMNGYSSVFKGIKVDEASKFRIGDHVRINQPIGTYDKVFLFEIRTSGSTIYGYEGTLDPGLFYVETSGLGIAAASKSLTISTPSNPNAVVGNTGLNSSSELVKLRSINTIITTLPLSGSLNAPGQQTVVSATTETQVGKASANSAILPPDQAISSLSKTPQDWVVEADHEQLKSDIRSDEGTLEYQRDHKGSYRDGKFFMFRDPVDPHMDIGYGHLCLGDTYPQGLTLEEVEQLLTTDLLKQVNDAKKIAIQYNMKIPELAQLVLVEMCYQMGRYKVLEFKKMLSALASGNYSTAANEIRSSVWYNQTTARAEKQARRIQSLG